MTSQANDDIRFLSQCLVDQEQVLDACEGLLREALADSGVECDFETRLERYWESSKALGDWRSRELRLAPEPPAALRRYRHTPNAMIHTEGGEWVSYHDATSQPPDREWQPIETARKDGKAFLVFCPERANTYMVYRKEAFYGDKFMLWATFEQELTQEATHWMELPPNPSPTKEVRHD